MKGTMRSNTTPLHFVAMFSLDVGLFWFDPPPLVFFVVPPELEPALGALQFSQHLLLGSPGCQPNVQKGKQGALAPPRTNPALGRFVSRLYQSKVSQQTSSAHLPSRCTLSHFKLQWHFLFGFHCISAVVEHVTFLKSSAD